MQDCVTGEIIVFGAPGLWNHTMKAWLYYTYLLFDSVVIYITISTLEQSFAKDF